MWENFENIVHNPQFYPWYAFDGMGIVVCAGGNLLVPAWVNLNILRQIGCRLSVELWIENQTEMNPKLIQPFERLGVHVIDASTIESTHPRRQHGGWQLKSYALMWSAFSDVLLLDADNMCINDPIELFQNPSYLRTGAIFWQDTKPINPQSPIWQLTGVAQSFDRSIERGQMVVNKRKSWHALQLVFWLNDHSDQTYRYIYGDKDTFFLAWRRLEEEWTWSPYAPTVTPHWIGQKDFAGNILFQHRFHPKWTTHGNRQIDGQLLEQECLSLIDQYNRIVG